MVLKYTYKVYFLFIHKGGEYMEYSMVGITALIILLIINHDVIFVKKRSGLSKPNRAYSLFVYSLLLFSITDILWGIFNEYHII